MKVRRESDVVDKNRKGRNMSKEICEWKTEKQKEKVDEKWSETMKMKERKAGKEEQCD